MKKRIIPLIFLIILIYFFFYLNSNAVTKVFGIENFPRSYIPYLKEISKKYPNWKFTALYTGLDWDYVINNENEFGKNLVPLNYSDNWKNIEPDKYNVEVDLGWVPSSKQAVEYCMDPRNFLNEVRIFQFEELSYNADNSIDGIEKILYGTEFYKCKVSYLDGNGNIINMNDTYSDLILNAAKASNVSSYHLASRIKQEVGPFLTHSSIAGNIEGYEGLYNFYNIGATSSPEPLGAIKNGLRYAKNGNNATEDIKSRFLIPWYTKEKAITGGAIFIGSNYINIGQNTIYLQKFDVNKESNTGLFWHQYMTNVLAPYTESKSIYTGYKNSGLLNSSMSFIIPIYNNMPEIPVQSPNISYSDFISDNTQVFCNATNVNVRTGPSTSYEIITTVTNPDRFIRIEKGVQNGERWDRVILETGIVGYIYQKYVTEISVRELEENEVNIDKTLNVNSFYIGGLEYGKNTVSNLKSKITTKLDIEIVNYKNQVLSDDSFVGTGSKIRIKENGIILREYNIILYGDSNGDGRINSFDLLVLQRYILEIKEFEEIFKIACNINKTGKKPNSLDLLIIQRHILGYKFINQKEVL